MIARALTLLFLVNAMITLGEVGVEELGAVEGTGEATGVNERAGGFFSALMTSGVSNHAC